VHFDEWSGSVAIQQGGAQIGENALVAGRRSSTVAGAIAFGGQVTLTVTPSESGLVAHIGQSALPSPVQQPTVK
jgi:hypothetical protein